MYIRGRQRVEFVEVLVRDVVVFETVHLVVLVHDVIAHLVAVQGNPVHVVLLELALRGQNRLMLQQALLQSGD